MASELDDDLSSPITMFVVELEEVCRKYGFQLAVSGYDGLNIWKLAPGEPPIYAAGIEDCTMKEKKCG